MVYHNIIPGIECPVDDYCHRLQPCHKAGCLPPACCLPSPRLPIKLDPCLETLYCTLHHVSTTPPKNPQPYKTVVPSPPPPPEPRNWLDVVVIKHPIDWVGWVGLRPLTSFAFRPKSGKAFHCWRHDRWRMNTLVATGRKFHCMAILWIWQQTATHRWRKDLRVCTTYSNQSGWNELSSLRGASLLDSQRGL